MRFLLPFIALLIAGCANQSTPMPVVDMRGVDMSTHNRDMAECIKNRPFIRAGSYLSDCMSHKGYKVLAEY